MSAGAELLPLVDMLRRSGIEATIECLGGNIYGVKAHTRAGFEVLVTTSQENPCKVDAGLYDPDDPDEDEPIDMALEIFPSVTAKTLKGWGC